MKHGAQVVKGELKSALLDGDTQNYDLDHGFSRHPIEDEGRAGIQVKLGQASIINHIRILLWDRDSRYGMRGGNACLHISYACPCI